MKTAEVFERTHRPLVEKPQIRMLKESEIPPRRPAPERPAPTTWPPRATATAVVLAVVALVLGVAAIVGFATGDEATDPELEQTIATLTVERDDLTAEVATLDEAMTELADERDGLDSQVVSLEDELGAALAEREQLLIAADVQTGTIEDLDATIGMLVDENRALVVDVARANDQLDAQRQDTVAALAERDALLDLFPIRVDTELDPRAVPGGYDVDIDQVYCVGFDNCGTVPAIDELTIRQTADGRLELVIDGYPVPGLAEVDGVLYAAMDLTITEADGTTRIARTIVTVFAEDVTVADDGVQTVTSLGASLTMAAPASGGHPVGTAVFALELTPQS